MIKSKYYIQARLFPSVLTVIPLLIFVNVITLNFQNEITINILNAIPLLSELGISAALIFLMVQINRFIAKEVIQHFYFQDEMNMPTTNQLLWSNSVIDESVKDKIHTKIQTMFHLTLMSDIEEVENEIKAKNQIVTAVSQIRNSLRDNKLLLQHNIEYGFFRNLLGGSLLAILFSVIIIIYGILNEDNSLIITGVILAIVYLIPLLLSKIFMKRFGNYYSKILFEQFLSI